FQGFFKRSITRGDKYKCFFGGECDLTPKNRNRCKSCRFKRCLDTGMAVEAVRMGRIPKVEKEKALEVFHQEGADFNKLELRLEQTGAGNYDFQLNPKNEDRNRDTEVNPAEHKDKANQDAAYHHDDGFQEFKQEKTAFQHETYGNHKADYNGQNKMSREMLHSPQRENASPFYWPSETTPSVGGRSSPAPSTFSKDSNGSGSSKSNPYSPLLIKLLMEQVLETNNGGNVIEKLKEKLSLSKLDSVTAGRVIGLLKEATGHLVAKSDRTTSSQNTSHTGSTDLSDSKQERIALFLDDVKSNLPIDKSKRCSHKRKWSDNEMLVSLRDLDMERSVKMHLDGSSGPQPNTPLSHTHSHNTSVTHSSVSLSGQARLVLPTLSYGNPEVLDNSMSSIEETQVGNLDHERFKNLKDGLNLGVKILFRLKPEHREKLRLYREGKLFLRVLTDSEEDVQLIYEKLINGIPDLSQRILEYFHNGNSYWILPTGEIYSAPAMRKILNDEIVDIIMTFADKFNVLKLTDLEVVILSAVILTKTVGLELEETEAVNTLNSELLELFSLEVRKNHSDHTGLILDVFSLTPLMDEINRIQKEIIGKFSTSGINKKVEGAVKDGRITNGKQGQSAATSQSHGL
ncbi:NR1D1-like protein, partial [Mya arenaria]